MKIERLFNTLVLGGAVLVAGCANPTPVEKPQTQPAAASPAKPAAKKEKAAEDKTAPKEATDEDKSGVCSWL